MVQERKTPPGEMATPRELYALVSNNIQWVKNDDVDCMKRMHHLLISMVFAGFHRKITK